MINRVPNFVSLPLALMLLKAKETPFQMQSDVMYLHVVQSIPLKSFSPSYNNYSPRMFTPHSLCK